MRLQGVVPRMGDYLDFSPFLRSVYVVDIALTNAKDEFPALSELRSTSIGSQRITAKKQQSQQSRSLRNQGCSLVALVLFLRYTL